MKFRQPTVIQTVTIREAATIQPLRRAGQRLGFTLIELIIVMAIISVLAVLVLPIIGNALGQPKTTATKTTLKKANELLRKRLDGFEREFPTWFKQTYNEEYKSTNPDHIKIRKRKFQKMFPQFLPGEEASAADNAEALYYLLTKGRVFGSNAEDADNFSATEVGDTDDDGHMELVDAWGNPIRWYPWPTRLVRSAVVGTLITNLPSDINHDGDDPIGWMKNENGFEKNYHTPDTYHPPLIVSAGSDGELGLYEAYDKTNYGHLAAPISTTNTDALDDNLTNMNSLQGVK